MRLVDLETRSYKGGTRDSNFLAKRIQEVFPNVICLTSSWRKNYKIVSANFRRTLGWIAMPIGNSNPFNLSFSRKKRHEHAWSRIYCGVMRRI
jgi:hypothetical protein